jgi:hypothetical protein
MMNNLALLPRLLAIIYITKLLRQAIYQSGINSVHTSQETQSLSYENQTIQVVRVSIDWVTAEF